MSLRIFPAKVENLRSQPGCLQRYLSGPLHVNVSSPRGAAGLCNNATVALTLTIAKIKGKAWENWLQAQPFRKLGSKKIPYISEKEMMRDLSDAVAEID
ncbi:hypothetical protein [Ralstonia pseudosolanacearum]|uniref:hypothetical protein n=1 Tax=Ralstonia pseudosolanacearum TaxID=1310165 RepID=UPI003F79AE87